MSALDVERDMKHAAQIKKIQDEQAIMGPCLLHGKAAGPQAGMRDKQRTPNSERPTGPTRAPFI